MLEKQIQSRIGDHLNNSAKALYIVSEPNQNTASEHSKELLPQQQNTILKLLHRGTI